MVSYYLIFGLIIGGIGGLVLIYILYNQYIRGGTVYIAPKDVDRITKSINPKRETGGTIDQKPSKEYAKITLERTGKEYNGRPGIIIRQESDDEAVWHSHPRYDHPYVNARNEVPSPEDISVMMRSGNSADVVVTPSGKFKRYGKTPQTRGKMRFIEKIDPTGYLITRRLRGTMKKIEREHPKSTVKDADSINKEWGRRLKSEYGIKLETERKTKSGVKIDNMEIKEVN